MFNIDDIKIGDYVEDKEGDIGYVVRTSEDYFDVMYTSRECQRFTKTKENIYICFKQIGIHKFNKEEKKCKIQKLDSSWASSPLIAYTVNEIIDFLNNE